MFFEVLPATHLAKPISAASRPFLEVVWIGFFFTSLNFLCSGEWWPFTRNYALKQVTVPKGCDN